MKFVRQLFAVVLTVAVVVGLGLLWAHVSGGGTGGGTALRPAPPHAAVVRLKSVHDGAIGVGVRPDSGFQLTDTGDLIRTCLIEAALAALVITFSAVRRRQRRMRRTAA